MEITRIENIKIISDSQQLEATQPIIRPQELANEEFARSIAATALANVIPAFAPGAALSTVSPLREQPVSEIQGKYGNKFPKPVFRAGIQNNNTESSFDMVA